MFNTTGAHLFLYVQTYQFERFLSESNWPINLVYFEAVKHSVLVSLSFVINQSICFSNLPGLCSLSFVFVGIWNVMLHNLHMQGGGVSGWMESKFGYCISFICGRQKSDDMGCQQVHWVKPTPKLYCICGRCSTVNGVVVRHYHGELLGAKACA